MEYITKCLLHVTCSTLRRWRMIEKGIEGGGRAMDVNATVARKGKRGREVVMYVLWGGCWWKVEMGK